MAKKTKKKTHKKRSKKTVLSETAMKVRLHCKIMEVMQQHPEIECAGKGTDFDGNEFAFTEAADVFSAYGQSMRDFGLTCIPIEKSAVLGKTAYMIHVKYKLTDIDTGYSEIIAGTGLGTNGQWAANTAQTLALKQALLETFMASWPQPPKYKEIVKKEAQKVFGPAQSPEEMVEAMNEFFGNYPVKGVPDGPASNSKNRVGKKQPHKSGGKAPGKKSGRR